MLVLFHRTTGAFMKNAVAVILLGFASAAGATSFPEVPFCPFGGPSGWMNRMTDHDGYDRGYRYPPSGYYPSPYYQPGQAYGTYPAPLCDPNRHTCFRR
jgi:hypothetical protein